MQIDTRYKWFYRALYMIGLVIGVWHLRLALMAIYLFHANEPITSWVSVIAGPCMTLPVMVYLIINNKRGGILLVCAGLVSTIIMSIGEHFNHENLIPFMYMISAPMMVIGTIFILRIKITSYTH